MRIFFIFVIGLLLLAAGAAAIVSVGVIAHHPASGISGDRPESMIWDGIQRTYILHLPAVHGSNHTIPLVIVLHGHGGTASGMVRMTNGEFDALSDKNEFLVVYPDGLNKSWNDGREDSVIGKKGTDDTGFLSALIDSMIRNEHADPTRIYVTGMSNGAMMCYRLAAQITGRLTAIAPVAGSIPETVYNNFSPTRPLSLLAINGTMDKLVPWNGGDVRGPFGMRKFGTILPIERTVEFWMKIDKCSPTPEQIQIPDRDPKDGTRVSCTRYSGGLESSEVILYKVDGGGHTWPGGTQYLPQWIVGKLSNDMNACDVIWDFFSRHSRRAE